MYGNVVLFQEVGFFLFSLSSGKLVPQIIVDFLIYLLLLSITGLCEKGKKTDSIHPGFVFYFLFVVDWKINFFEKKIFVSKR